MRTHVFGVDNANRTTVFSWSARVAARPQVLSQVHIFEMLTTNGFDCGFDSALNTTFEGNLLFTGKQK